MFLSHPRDRERGRWRWGVVFTCHGKMKEISRPHPSMLRHGLLCPSRLWWSSKISAVRDIFSLLTWRRSTCKEMPAGIALRDRSPFFHTGFPFLFLAGARASADSHEIEANRWRSRRPKGPVRSGRWRWWGATTGLSWRIGRNVVGSDAGAWRRAAAQIWRSCQYGTFSDLFMISVFVILVSGKAISPFARNFFLRVSPLARRCVACDNSLRVWWFLMVL